MTKTAFIFPGQGSQSPGMGKELAEEFSVVAETFTEADQVLDIDLQQLCFEGPEEELTKTEHAQPAILTASIAYYRLLQEKGIKPEVVAGHSLGEYSALVAAGVVDFATGLQLVRKRGELMAAADPEGKGTMAAVIGLKAEEIDAVCKEAAETGVVEVANYNCPGQIVISGEQKAVETAETLAKEAGAKKVVPLNVSGPFHSSLMESAGEKLAAYLADLSFKQPEVPVVPNAKADYTTDPAEIKDALIKQMSGSVRWEESIERMIEDGVESFVEVGPGRVLKGFMRRIDRSVTAVNVRNQRSLDKTLKKL